VYMDMDAITHLLYFASEILTHGGIEI